MASSMSTTDKLYISLLSIWVMISVGSNMSVIACIWKTSKDRQTAGRRRSLTSTDILLVSLALNDILLAGVVLPQKIHDISHTGHFFERKSVIGFVFNPSDAMAFLKTYLAIGEGVNYPRCISGSVPPRDKIPKATPMFLNSMLFNGHHSKFHR